MDLIDLFGYLRKRLRGINKVYRGGFYEDEVVANSGDLSGLPAQFPR